MLKKFSGILSFLVLAVFMFGSAAVYADGKSAPTVFVDGFQLTFEANPFIDNGSTSVPFRAIFEKLGLTVKWDSATQTVTGSNDQLKIQLKIGSSTATVNGQTKELSLAPKIVENVTFVPLRFVGEASGREVSWDGLTHTIYIADTATQIKHIYERQAIAFNNNDLEGAVSVLDPDSPANKNTKNIYERLFSIFKFKITNDEITILKIEGDSAQVHFTFTVRKVEGPQYKDGQYEQVDYLTRINGEWKIRSSDVKKITYLN